MLVGMSPCLMSNHFDGLLSTASWGFVFSTCANDQLQVLDRLVDGSSDI